MVSPFFFMHTLNRHAFRFMTTTAWRLCLCGAALACGLGHAATVKYMLWDASQLPVYRQCAADFEKQHPGTRIQIRQAGWDDYWTAISMGFISDTAPDVFVNHLSKYPEIVHNGLLVNLTPYIARDQADTRLFNEVLLQAWARQGQQFGQPKDWDTVAMVVNLAHAQQQGIRLSDLQQMDWNPRDGGSFERIVRQLTVDRRGHNANSPLFDPKQVAVYGYQNPGAGGMSGQTEWSHFAASNGFRYQDAPWSPRLHYDSPRLAETIDYLASLPGKGVSAPSEHTRSLGTSGMWVSQRVAMVPDGSWMIHYYQRNARFEYAWVPLPKGPGGTRASMLNGTADSIWIGSKVKEQAWQWVKYLASADCQRSVAQSGVVFPAARGTADIALQAHRQKGVDSSAFVTMSQSQTFLPPIADKAAQINEIIGGAIEASLQAPGQSQQRLKTANDQVHRLRR